jgi:hypothetical protein
LATVGAALATVATLIFFGFQPRTQLRQIEAQVKQTTYMEKQTTLQAAAEQARHLQVRRQQASKIIVKMHRVNMRWWKRWWSLRTRWRLVRLRGGEPIGDPMLFYLLRSL